MIFARKIIFPDFFFGGEGGSKCSPPVSYAYDKQLVGEIVRRQSSPTRALSFGRQKGRLPVISMQKSLPRSFR